MAGHIHGRINEKLTMIMSDMKIWFLILAAMVMIGCAWDQGAYEAALPLGAAVQQGAANYASAVQRNQPNYLTPTVQMPSNYVRRNAITGQLETVTNYGNGIQNVWPVGQ